MLVWLGRWWRTLFKMGIWISWKDFNLRLSLPMYSRPYLKKVTCFKCHARTQLKHVQALVQPTKLKNLLEWNFNFAGTFDHFSLLPVSVSSIKHWQRVVHVSRHSRKLSNVNRAINIAPFCTIGSCGTVWTFRGGPSGRVVSPTGFHAIGCWFESASMLAAVFHFRCKRNNNPTGLNTRDSCPREAALSHPDHWFPVHAQHSGEKRSESWHY